MIPYICHIRLLGLLLFGTVLSVQSQPAKALGNHRAGVEALAVSPDGKLVAASDGGRIFISEARSGRVLRSLTSRGDIRQVALSPDGNLVAAAGADVEVRDAATGDLFFLFSKPSGSFRSVAFSPDGRILAAGGSSDLNEQPAGSATVGEIRFWEMRSGRLIRTLRAAGTDNRPRLAHITTLVWAADGSTLAVAGPSLFSDAGSAPDLAPEKQAERREVWDARTGELMPATVSPATVMLAAAAVPDPSPAVIKKTGATLGATIEAVEFSTDDRWLAATGSDGVTGVWNTRNWRQEKSIVHDAPIADLAFVETGGQTALATAGNPGVKLWPLGSDEQAKLLFHTESAVHLLRSSRDGNALFVACRESPFGIWDVAAGRWRWRVHTGQEIGQASISPDGKFVATVAGNQIEWRDARDGRVLRRILWSEDEAENLEEEEEDAAQRDTDSSEVRNGGISSLDISPDGTRLLAHSWRRTDYGGVLIGELRLWNVADGRLLSTVPTSSATGRAQFLRDGSGIVFGSGDGFLEKHEVLSGKNATVLLLLWKTGGAYHGLGRD